MKRPKTRAQREAFERAQDEARVRAIRNSKAGAKRGSKSAKVTLARIPSLEKAAD